MDAVTLAAANAAAGKKFAPLGPLSPRRSTGVAYLGDSLMANDSTPGQTVATVNTAAAIGDTSLSLTYAYTAGAGFSNVSPPVANIVYVIEPDTAREEFVFASAVTGAGPYTLTVSALTFAHAPGALVRSSARAWSARSVPMWLAMLSGNRARFGGLYAHGGYTTQQVHDIYLPQILARTTLPGIVVINTGTNDSYDLVGALPLTLGMIDTLMGKGILPIVTSCPPFGGTANITLSAPRLKWNHALSEACVKRGIPFVDIYSPLVDDGSGSAGAGIYKAGLNGDNTHPNEAGAKVWAQAMWTAIQQFFPFYGDTIGPAINAMNGDTTAYPSNAANAILLTDTNSDGIPDGWSLASGTATPALITQSGMPGKLFQATLAAGATADATYSSASFNLVTGHKYRVYLRLVTSGLDAAWSALSSVASLATNSTFGGFHIRLLESHQLSVGMFSLLNWKRDVAATTLSFDFVMPPGLSTSVNWSLTLKNGGASCPAFSVAVQPFLVDLTYLGIA